MTEYRYDYVDNRNIPLTPNKQKCCCDGNANNKINEITKGAPVDMDTFKEVSDAISDIKRRLNNIELEGGTCNGEGVDLSEYAKKRDLCRYVTKHEAGCFVTSAEMEAELSKINLNNFATKDELDEAIKNVSTADIDLTAYETKENAEATYAKKTDLNEKANKDLLDTVIHTLFEEDYFAKTEVVDEKIAEALKSIDVPVIDGFATKAELEEYVKRTEIPVFTDFVTKSELDEIFTSIDKESIDALFE